jgi:hypothetical protein
MSKPLMPQWRTLTAGIVLVVFALFLWTAWAVSWPALEPIVRIKGLGSAIGTVVALVGTLAFGSGWVLVGAGVRPRGDGRLGARLAMAMYVLAGLAWVAVWNSALRIRRSYMPLIGAYEELTLPPLDEAAEVISGVLMWPLLVLAWLRNELGLIG